MAQGISYNNADVRMFIDGREVGHVQPLNVTASIDPEYRPSDTYGSRRRVPNLWQNLASEITQPGIFTPKEMTLNLSDIQVDIESLYKAMGYTLPQRDNEYFAEKKLEQW